MKTHYPFLNSMSMQSITNSSFGGDRFPGLLLTVRHPLPNYDSWRRFLSDKDRKIAPQSTFREFMAKWVLHFKVWEEYAERSRTPLLLVRYEDLMADPYKTFSHLFVALGLLEDLGLSSEELARAVEFAIDQHRSIEITFPVSQCFEKNERRPFHVPEYDNAAVCGQNVAADDLLWLDRNYRSLLGKFGYDTLPKA